MGHILFISPISVKSGPTYILMKFLEKVAARHETTVVSCGDGELFGNVRSLGIPVYRAPSGLAARDIPWLLQLIRRERISLVYGCGYTSGVRNALVAAKVLRRPFIWHINEMIKADPRAHRGRVLALPSADAIISDSLAADRAIKRHLPSPEKVHLIYNGISSAEFRLDRARARTYVREALGVPGHFKVVLNAGLICRRKGQLEALEVADRVLSARDDTAFAFLGAWDLEPEYARQVSDRAEGLNGHGRIHLLGFRDDFPEFAAGSDVLLHTAAEDAMPLVVLKAHAAGRPVVAFGVDGLLESVLDGESGFLTAPGDAAGAAASLSLLLDDPDLADEMGARGRAHVESVFSQEEMSRRVIETIDEVLGR